MQIPEALVLLAGVLLAQVSAMPFSSESNEEHKEDSSRSQVRFLSPSEKFLKVAMNGSASIDCQVEDDEGVKFLLFYTPTLTQPAVERPLQENKLSLSNGWYTLGNVEELDYGHYYCTAQRDNMNIRKNFTIVPLQQRVTSVITPQDPTAEYMSEQTITCTCWSEDCQVTMNIGAVRGEVQKYESKTQRSSHKVEYVKELVNLKTTLTVQCTAQRRSETSTSSVTVFVTGAPPEIRRLEKVELEDGSVEIECKTSGTDQIVIFWTHEGMPITDCGSQCQDADFSMLGDKLKILRINENTVGVYRCHATDLFGMIEESVTIEPPESKP